jgi:hypothetical protein
VVQKAEKLSKLSWGKRSFSKISWGKRIIVFSSSAE